MSEQKKDFSYLDRIAIDANQWKNLSKNEIQIMTFRTCFLYGECRNKKMIPVLFRMYEYLISQTTSNERTKLLVALSSLIRKKNTKAIMALFPFFQVETDGDIIRSAAQFFLNLSAINNKEYHSGANILLELIKDAPNDNSSAYLILGITDIENEKLNQMLRKVLPQLGSVVISTLQNNGIRF